MAAEWVFFFANAHCLDKAHIMIILMNRLTTFPASQQFFCSVLHAYISFQFRNGTQYSISAQGSDCYQFIYLFICSFVCVFSLSIIFTLNSSSLRVKAVFLPKAFASIALIVNIIFTIYQLYTITMYIIMLNHNGKHYLITNVPKFRFITLVNSWSGGFCENNCC